MASAVKAMRLRIDRSPSELLAIFR
jgi:hypothetical protein